MSGEWLQVLYVVGGAVLGWLAKRGSPAPGPLAPAPGGLPDELLDLLRRLLERRQARQTRGLLEELLAELQGQPEAGGPTPPARPK